MIVVVWLNRGDKVSMVSVHSSNQYPAAVRQFWIVVFIDKMIIDGVQMEEYDSSKNKVTFEADTRLCWEKLYRDNI